MIVAVIALTYGLRAIVGYRQVNRDADDDYAYKSREGMIPKGVSRDAYIRAYRRFHAPRSTAYVAGAMSAILLLTYPILVITQFMLERFWIWSGRSIVIEPGFLVWQFMIFFIIIGTWAGIGYISARQYHSRAPISFEQELERENTQS